MKYIFFNSKKCLKSHFVKNKQIRKFWVAVPVIINVSIITAKKNYMVMWEKLPQNAVVTEAFKLCTKLERVILKGSRILDKKIYTL